MGELVSVTFVPGGVSTEVEPGVTLLVAASRAGLIIPAPCGGRGACGRCAVSVEVGELESPSETELRALARAKATPDSVRLACMARVRGPVTVHARALLGGRSADASQRFGARRKVVGAVDLGTTTVSATVVDATTGERLGTGSVGNRQSAYGADILSRISTALSGGGAEMRGAAEASMIEAIELACEDAGVAPGGFERIVVAANTAMLSLLAGVDVRELAVHPFVHSIPEPVLLHSTVLTEAFPGASILALPPIAAFIGGDLSAGLISQGLAENAEGVAYLDIGTNAEIAVFSATGTYLASAPAGPAFEGWGISCGGPANESGIVSMSVAGDGSWYPITPGGEATHLTGSGLLSAVAALRRADHLDPDGRLSEAGPLSGRFFSLPDGVLAVSLGVDSQDRDVYLSQLDVRAFQYAKAAVCVALRICCRAAGTTGDDLREYVLAGSFGGALAEEDLIHAGVVPLEARGRLRYAGEAALGGAAAVALEPSLIDVAGALAARAHHVDLAAEESFSERFMGQMRLEPFSL